MLHNSRHLRRGAAGLFTLCFMVLASNVATAKMVSKQNLLDLMTHTESILVGTVTEKTDGFQNGLPYTEITLNVSRSLKGKHGSSYTFRQFGLIKPRSTEDGRVNLMVTPAGWPTYVEGEQVALFLHRPAAKTGLQTTAGLTQGKFTLHSNQIVNGTENEALFSGLRIDTPLNAAQRELLKHRSGSLPAADFLALIEAAVNERWIENGVMTHE